MSHVATFSANNPDQRDNSYFIAALLLSLVLHTLALVALHPFNFNAEKPATILDVALAQPPKPPAPPPELQKPKEPPPKPTPKRLPLEPIKTLPAPTVAEPLPRAEPVPPPVISVPQKATAEPPTFTAPPPEPPPKTVNTADIDAARNLYGAQLTREFARHKQYPRLAQMRGWQGTVQVQVQIDATGTMISSSISQSSGHEVLDKQALEMVKKAYPLPQPPEALRDRDLTMLVPIVFRLE